jgi:hypothetical protein
MLWKETERGSRVERGKKVKFGKTAAHGAGVTVTRRRANLLAAGALTEPPTQPPK